MEDIKHYLNFTKYIRNYLFYWVKTDQILPIICFKTVELHYIKRFMSFLTDKEIHISEQSNVTIPISHFPYLCDEIHKDKECSSHPIVFFTNPIEEPIKRRFIIKPEEHITINDEQEFMIKSADNFEELYFNSSVFYDINDQLFNRMTYYKEFPHKLHLLYRKLYADTQQFPLTASIRTYLTIDNLSKIYTKNINLHYPSTDTTILSFEIKWLKIQKDISDEESEKLHQSIVSYMEEYFPEIIYKISYYKNICRSMIHFNKDDISHETDAFKKKYEIQTFLEYFQDFIKTIPDSINEFFC
jgi:hypothetical protein